MKKKHTHVEQPIRADGSYWWVRIFVPLRGGHYHHSWEMARIEGDRIRLFGSQKSLPLNAPFLQNALWSGPLLSPLLEETSAPALALGIAGNQQQWRNHPDESQAGEDDLRSAKIDMLARGIVNIFVEASTDLRDVYAKAPEKVEELVQKMVWLIERLDE